MAISAFFDESGKFKDKRVIVFGGVASPQEDLFPFSRGWNRCLHDAGLRVLTMKEALKAQRPLSERLPALGVEARTEALLPFIACLRKYLEAGVGVAMDAEVFRATPPICKDHFRNDPVYTAFLRTVLWALSMTDENDQIGLTCDDEEETALPMYGFYRKVKIVYPTARKRLVALSFADDEFVFALQAADMVSSLVRREAERKFLGVAYDYTGLYEALIEKPQRYEKWSFFDTFFADTLSLGTLCEHLKEIKAATQANG